MSIVTNSSVVGLPLVNRLQFGFEG